MASHPRVQGVRMQSVMNSHEKETWSQCCADLTRLKDSFAVAYVMSSCHDLVVSPNAKERGY